MGGGERGGAYNILEKKLWGSCVEQGQFSEFTVESCDRKGMKLRTYLVCSQTIFHQHKTVMIFCDTCYISYNKRGTFRAPGPGCSKLTKSLVNQMLKFQTLISQICQ